MAVIIITYVFIQKITNVSVAIEILLGVLEGDPILFFLRNFKNMIMILRFIFGNEIIKRKVLERLIISYRIFINWILQKVSALVEQLNKRTFSDEALELKVKFEFHSQLHSIFQLFAL